jgi:glycosyltransferase involved in cell wall biosynthesis
MKIGIDIRNIGKKRTGDEVVFFNLTKNLAEIDRQNEYFLLTDIENKDILEEATVNLGITSLPNVKIISLKTKNRFSWNFWTLPRYIRENPLDIYLTQYITPWFVPRATKIITIIHDISFNFHPKLIKKSDLFFLKILIPLSLRRADKIIGVSRFTRDEIWKYYKVDPEKLDWIHNAVSDNYENIKKYPEKIAYAKKRYKLPEKYILYLGTHQPRKNIPTLIDAYERLINSKDNPLDDPKPSLVLAGGRTHNIDLQIDESIKDMQLEGKVIFPGFISENHKFAVLAGARVFVFPSFYEGFGIPILEAFAAGVPVVASDILPHREIAEGVALFFDPDNPGELAEKMGLILRDEKKRQELIDLGKERVKKFSWRDSAEKILEIFYKTSGFSN